MTAAIASAARAAIASGARAPEAHNAEHERLRRTARDLEGVFVEQMFKAMRETVPDGGVVSGGSGEEMFTALLDQRMAAIAPDRWERGLSDALYQQLRGRVGSSSPTDTPIISATSSTDVSRPEPS